MRESRVFLILLVIVAGAASGSCGAAAKPAATTPAPAATAAAAAPGQATHENLNATLWMQTAVEYQASARQAYRTARLSLDAALADPSATAATEQTGATGSLPPAVVLDLDETVLDNSPFEARMIADSTPDHTVSYDPAAWGRWVGERKATAIPGAVEFLRYAVAHGVTPVYITNRKTSDADGQGEAATIDVLRKLGIPVDMQGDTVLMRNENGWTTDDKGPRRAFVASKYRILLLVGDNVEDFISVTDKSLAGRQALADKYADRWGSRWIMLPNPTYGSWEQSITAGVASTDLLAKKRAALRLAR